MIYQIPVFLLSLLFLFSRTYGQSTVQTLNNSAAPAPDQQIGATIREIVPPQYGYFSLENNTVMIGANLLYQSGEISPKEFNGNTSVAHSLFTKTFDFPLSD